MKKWFDLHIENNQWALFIANLEWFIFGQGEHLGITFSYKLADELKELLATFFLGRFEISETSSLEVTYPECFCG